MTKGFTLIETIVVFAVISILSTVAIASFVNYNKTQNVQVAYSELTATLALARSRALSQIKPQQCTSILNGYKVTLDVSGSKYKLYAVCSENLDIEIQTASLPKNVIFDGDVTKTTSILFYFSVITNSVTFTQANAP